MKWTLALLVLAGGAIGKAAPAQAMIAAPYTRVFGNEDGQVQFKVVPTKEMKAVATLSRLGEDGAAKTLWTKALDNVPGRVWVSNNWEPYVVTTDSWADAGGAHSIVIYDPKGKVVADIKGDDFLPALPKPKPGEPIMIVMDGGGRNWSQNAEIGFEPRWNPTHLVVQLYDGEAKQISMQTAEGTLTGSVRKRGEQIRIDLKTGEMKKLTGAQIAEANAAAKLPPPLQVMTFKAPKPIDMNESVTGPFGTAPGGDVVEAPGGRPMGKEKPRKTKGGEGALVTDAKLAKELRAVPETANGVTLSAELWRDLMPQIVEDGKKPEPRPLMLVARLLSEDGKDAPNLEALKVWVVNADDVWSAPLEKGADAGSWNARGGPEWKPGTKVDVIVEVRNTITKATGERNKSFRVRAADCEIIGAM